MLYVTGAANAAVAATASVEQTALANVVTYILVFLCGSPAGGEESTRAPHARGTGSLTAARQAVPVLGQAERSGNCLVNNFAFVHVQARLESRIEIQGSLPPEVGQRPHVRECRVRERERG